KASRRALPPKELVRTMSAPASTKALCSARTRSGCAMFQASGGSPEARPIANRLVPVAPSARRKRRLARSDRSKGILFRSRLALKRTSETLHFLVVRIEEPVDDGVDLALGSSLRS